jgi:hypothetical protein
MSTVTSPTPTGYGFPTLLSGLCYLESAYQSKYVRAQALHRREGEEIIQSPLACTAQVRKHLYDFLTTLIVALGVLKFNFFVSEHQIGQGRLGSTHNLPRLLFVIEQY